EVDRFYDRLPAKAEGMVREPVWNLSHHSAGMLTRFETDADEIWVDYRLRSEQLALSHMPATGVSGLDLYALDDEGRWRWVSVLRPSEQNIKAKLVTGLMPRLRSYMLYLPLYNGVDFLKIGVDKKASFKPIPPRSERPVVFYGTSITHGACASRPGMPHPAILGRRLDCPVVNLGFSGNGLMEPEVGALLAELDPVIYVIDCLPNMTSETVAERAEPLVRQLRSAHSRTPIVLVEDRTYANAAFVPERQARNRGSRAELRKAYRRLLEAGVSDLFYLEGKGLLGEDREDTVDSSHPSDLGFMRMSDVFEPVLRTALKRY
ncbi:MAG: SGNH/GDSL hydrolase family protein, partial [bacterium]